MRRSPAGKHNGATAGAFGKKSAKAHRSAYFAPAWKRDGHESDVHYFAAHRSRSELQYFADDTSHPLNAIALKALAI